jgi:hypothetical protein
MLMQGAGISGQKIELGYPRFISHNFGAAETAAPEERQQENPW